MFKIDRLRARRS